MKSRCLTLMIGTLVLGQILTDAIAQNQVAPSGAQGIKKGTLLEQPLKDILAKIDTVPPKITGGFISITSSALAASMLLMAVNVTTAKRIRQGNVNVDSTPLIIESLRDSLLTLAEEDNTLFQKLLQGYKMPQATLKEKNIRDSTISVLTFQAAITPITAAEIMSSMSEIGIEFLPRSASSVSSDVVGSLYLLDGSMLGILALAESNLSGLLSEDKKELQDRVRQIRQKRISILQILNRN